MVDGVEAFEDQSTLGTHVERRQALYEMAHIYLDFYRSESGFAWVLRALEDIPQDVADPMTDLWFTITSVGRETFDKARFRRVLDWLSRLATDLFGRGCPFGLDCDLEWGFAWYADWLKDGSIVGAQRVVSQLLAMLVQKRVPSCLRPLELTKREQLSLEAQTLFLSFGLF